MAEINAELGGDAIDERRVPPPPLGGAYIRPTAAAVDGQERDLSGSYVAKRTANGRAVLVVDATAPPQARPSTVLTPQASALAKREGLSDAQAQAALNELADKTEFYRKQGMVNSPAERIYNNFQAGRSLVWSGNVVGKTVGGMGSAAADYGKGLAQGALVDTPKGIWYMLRHPIKTAQGLWHSITHPVETIDNAAREAEASANRGEAGFAIGRMTGGVLGGEGVGLAAKAATARAASALKVGEPVSVATGEYLETWRDFLVPGTFPFDGARYMALHLALPQGYASPLGPCQISMFDEVIGNPEPGRLVFHDRDGRSIPFDRPFNFLAATNPGYPNLQLKAPWLKQLTLKDGSVTKHFRQYGDRIYRLEKISDLNGFELAFTRTEAGLLVRAEGPDGLSLGFENDRAGRRTSIALTGTDGSQMSLARYGYDAGGRMTEADCAFGMSVRYAWQAGRDLLDNWRDASGTSATRFQYDEAGRVVHTATSGIWNDDRFSYADGETTYLPGGRENAAQRFRFDGNGNVTAEIDALGNTVTHGYDAAGFQVSTTDANGGASRTRYDANGNVGETVDAEGRSTVYVWGDDGELHLVIDGAGHRRTFEHDTRSNVVAETDAEGNTTRLSRDERGRVVATAFPDGATERREWDEHNRLASVTDANGNATRFEYDSFNRLAATTDAEGNTVRYGYQAGAGGFDTPSTVIRPDGVAAVRSFDAQGELASVADGEGRAWLYRHGAFGMLQSITDPNGGMLGFSYDSEGRLTGVTNALGLHYAYERDAAGRVVAEEDFDGRTTRYRRDGAGQVVETVKPDGATLRHAYDRSGLVRRIESFGADGAPEDVTRFWYDGRGLLVQAENNAALVEFERDRNGGITAETLNGKRIKSKRDTMGRRVSREITGLGGGLVEYVRDPLGLVAKMVVGETAINFRRDAVGRETMREAGGFALAQRYDAAGQLVAQTGGAPGAADLGLSRLGWNVAAGEGRPRRDGTVHRVYEYDRAFAPVRIDDGLWGETRFDYDGNNQIVSAGGARGTERFAYDAARNTAGTASAAPFSTESAGYGPEFDAAFGTVTPAAKPSPWQRTPGGVVQIARGPKGERIRLTHDDCGRLVERRVERDGFRAERWRYRWDAHDRLVSARRDGGEEWLFRFDPFGRRVAKVRRFSEAERERAGWRWPRLVDAAGAPRPLAPPEGSADDGNGLPDVGTAYLWDGHHMIAEAPMRLDGHIAWDRAVRWLFHENDVACHRLLAKELPAGTALPDGTRLAASALFPIVTDALGTPKEMFSTAGRLVWAADHHVWGALRAVHGRGALAVRAAPFEQADAFDCPWRFPGQYEDGETGLFYNRYRFYDPLAGQYASPDPIGLAGGERTHGYVANPAAWTDPLGLAASGPVNFMGNRDRFFQFASRRAASNVDPNGAFDVVAHGNAQVIEVMTPQGPRIVSHRTAAILIKNSPGYKRGQPVRMLSCGTGSCDTGFAQNLANKLGVPVSAPTDTLWATERGQLFVAPTLPNGMADMTPSRRGTFRTFQPRGP